MLLLSSGKVNNYVMEIYRKYAENDLKIYDLKIYETK